MEARGKSIRSIEIPPLLAPESLIPVQNLSKSQFGEVLTVKIAENDNLFTLKKILKSKIKRVESQFIREISRWYKIKHKNLQQVVSFTEDEDFFYLLMEHLQGQSLLKRLQSDKKLEKNSILQITSQLIDAIEHLHSLHPPVIYKHIKPENIFIDLNGNIKLSEFSWPSGSVDEDSNLLGASTLDYLAPEMFGKTDFGIAVDVWAVGVLIYEMSLGRSPFRKSSMTGILTDIQKSNVVYPQDADPLLKSLLAKILVSDPGRRIKISEIRGHKWFIKRKIDLFELAQVDVRYLKEKIEKQVSENARLAGKVAETQKEILGLNEVVEKLQEKVSNSQKILELLDDENCKSRNQLESLETEEQDIIESSETEQETHSIQIENLKKKIQVLECCQVNLLQIRTLKSASIETLSETHSMLSSQLYLLNEYHKTLLSPSLMMAKALVYSVPLAEVDFFNQQIGPVNLELSKTCESLLTKIQDIDNLIFLKERYFCELSVLYQEKQKELLKAYQENKNELESKAKRKQSDNYRVFKHYAEDLVDKKLKNLGFSEINVEIEELENKRKKFLELDSRLKETRRKIVLAKRDLLKIRIKAHRKKLDVDGKLSVLTNLTEAMLQAKVGLKIFKANRVC